MALIGKTASARPFQASAQISALKVFASPRMTAILFMGFSSGIPIALTGATLQAWMTDLHVDLGKIGLFSLVGIPYTLKFLWSPVMDRFMPPVLGRRRGWILLCQIALLLGIAALGFTQPAVSPGWTALIALCVTFFSASQDIVVDAYRTDLVADREELGPASALSILGYRVAMLVSGAIALILADHLPWRTVYLIMAATMGIGIVATLLAPEPHIPAKTPKSMKEAVAQPFIEFFRRRGSGEIIAFSVLYKVDVVMTIALMTPFIMGLGFTKTDIGAVTKGFGLIATIAGTLLGGALMVRLGIFRSLLIFGMTQAISGFSFFALALVGHSYPMMVAAIAAENICSGMGNAAFSAFLMSICDKRFSATQYALLSSLFALTRVVGGAPTGFMAQHWGWPTYYLVSVLVSVPGLLLLLRYPRWTQPEVFA